VTILVLSPHPDDEAIGCGGTILKHAADGVAVHVTFLTSGEAGGPRAGLGPVREAEAAEAGEILGVKEIEFWREPDGRLDARPELVERLTRRIRDLGATTIYVTHDREMHTDHQMAAVLAYRTLLALSSQGPAPPPMVLMYEVWTPLQEMSHIVDISDHIDKKLEAVRAHKTQCDLIPFDAAIRGLNRYRGELHSWPGGPYAEIFRSLNPSGTV
jgi:LmbE family N-acetylglucosaminyl deacetylase